MRQNSYHFVKLAGQSISAVTVLAGSAKSNILQRIFQYPAEHREKITKRVHIFNWNPHERSTWTKLDSLGQRRL